MDKVRICFILNPAAGWRKLRHFESQVTRVLDPTRFDWIVRRTAQHGEAPFLTATAIREGYDVIAAVGGDGTINEVAGAIGDADILLAIVPYGSGNGLARHLNIPLEVHGALKVIARMKSRVIDTAYLNGRKFFSIAGIGFDASVANRYRKVVRRGFFSYLRIVIMEFYRYKEQEYTIVADGKTMVRNALFITIANSNQFGYNTVIAPGADAGDGWLDLVIARKWPLRETPRIVHLVYTGRIDISPFIEIIRAKEIQVTRRRGKAVNLDGEAVRMGKIIKAWIVPSSLKVIIGAD